MSGYSTAVTILVNIKNEIKSHMKSTIITLLTLGKAFKDTIFL